MYTWHIREGWKNISPAKHRFAIWHEPLVQFLKMETSNWKGSKIEVEDFQSCWIKRFHRLPIRCILKYNVCVYTFTLPNDPQFVNICDVFLKVENTKVVLF